jgi:DNA transposition AAA+ family ATPase
MRPPGSNHPGDIFEGDKPDLITINAGGRMSLQEDLRTYLDEKGISQSRCAQQLGMSGATVSTWLKGEYKGNIGEIDIKVKAYLQQRRERDLFRDCEGLVAQTSTLERLHKFARMIHNERKIGACVASPGKGKTIGVYKYMQDNPTSILIETDYTYTGPVVFSELHKMLHCGSGRGEFHAIYSEVIERLRGSERLLIIDEAEYLSYKALELIRRLHDKAGIGILLVGTRKLIDNLKGSKGQYAQLFSRIRYVDLDTNELSNADVEKIVSLYVPASAAMAKTFALQSHRNPRVLVDILKIVKRMLLREGTELDVELIEKAATLLIIH